MNWREAPATTAITLGTAIVSLVIILTGELPMVAVNAGFIPLRLDGAVLPPDHVFAVPVWLTPLTATLIHGGFAHVGLNLVMLAYCGALAERAIGARGVGVLYAVGAYAAAAGHWLFGPHSPMPMVGASGAISAVVGAYALLYGQRRAQALGPVPAGVVHVLWLAAAWIGIQLLMGFSGIGVGSPIAIGAHIGGFIAGLILARPLLLWRYRGA